MLVVEVYMDREQSRVIVIVETMKPPRRLYRYRIAVPE